MATYNEVMAKIAASTKEDWVETHDQTERTYKGDLNIKIVDTTEEVLETDTLFSERWVHGVGFDHRAERRVFTIYYGTSFVRNVYTVGVDGFRAYIPFPKSADELVITHWQYKFAQIIQPPFNQLDSYLERVGIRVR
jgi:hypothetical protein